MKTKTLIILFALVMALSVSAGVFAQDASWDETWDEETVLQVLNEVDLIFPDLFADEDSDYLWVTQDPFGGAYPSSFSNKTVAKAPMMDDPVEDAELTFDPCGDGLIKYSVTLAKDTATVELTQDGPNLNKYGPEKESYIRNITATADDGATQLSVKKCNFKGEDNCNVVTFNKKGEAEISGYLYYPGVLTTTDVGKSVTIEIEFSNYFTALWDVPEGGTVKAEGVLAKSKKDYCQDTIHETDMAGVYAIRAKYDQHTGEARFQAVIRNFANDPNKEQGIKAKTNYVIPADVLVPYVTETASGDTAVAFERYTDYTCKYTAYNNGNSAPRTDYCEFGEGIALGTNALVRFDITVDHLSSNILLTYEEGKVPFLFRVGGMTYLVGGLNGKATKEYDENKYDTYIEGTALTNVLAETMINDNVIAAFAPVDYPCPIVSRMQVMDPLKPFTSFFKMDPDSPIKASGAYGVYEGGLWGMYQKCGKYAYMAVRLKNDGIQEEKVNLNNVAVAINGGTPMSWNWVLSSHEVYKNTIELEPGEDVVLIGRAKVTDYVYQMNSDQAITGAINFLDYGFYIQGKVYSDHNNTNCTVAP